jgi:hypothetical protein
MGIFGVSQSPRVARIVDTFLGPEFLMESHTQNSCQATILWLLTAQQGNPNLRLHTHREANNKLLPTRLELIHPVAEGISINATKMWDLLSSWIY